MQRATVYVEGMSCSGCEQAVERALTAVPGVRSVSASAPDGMARVEFEAPCTAEQLSAAVDASGYIARGVELTGSDARPAGAVRGAEAAAAGKGTCACAAAGQDFHGAAAVSTPAVPIRRPGTMDAVYLVIIAAGIFLIAQNLGINRFFQSIPTINGAGLGSAALFGIGLLTSVHCIAMCGGINLAQSVAIAPASANAGVAADTAAASGEHPRAGRGRASLALGPSLRYNAGRLVSYTCIGGVLGAAGQVVSISLGVRSIIGLLAGSFMVLAGLGMTGILAPLARLTPHLPRPVACAAASIARRGPFALGLVNGFMPCGPLQAMQVYAIASGSFAAGALSMASFCAGTIPLVLAFGVFAGTMHRTWRRAMLRVASVMMLIFGLFMLQSGLALVGVQLPGASASRAAGGFVRAQQDGDVQTVTTELRADGYDSIQVRAGVPVRWTIHAAAGTLNGCNGEVVLSGFDQQVKLVEGDNVIQFTPQKAGTYNFSCWMGMLHGQIVAN